jgi:hypothetical protein
MKGRSAGHALWIVCAVGCGGAQPKEVAASSIAPAPPERAEAETWAPSTPCPTALDAAELLARHAHAFGTNTALGASLPRTLRFEVRLEGKHGTAELALDSAGHHRFEESIAGIHDATGIDTEGAWSLGVAGVPLRLRPEEAAAVQVDAWILRRAYVDAFRAGRDTARCSAEHGTRVEVQYRLPELGMPELEFDFGSAALLSASALGADGTRNTTRYLAWSNSDEKGVRWPANAETTDAAGNRTEYQLTEQHAGLGCQAPVAAAAKDEARPTSAGPSDCFTPPEADLKFAWPASGKVRIPMRYYLGEISLRVRVNDRDAWALLDSGAGLTLIDGTTPAGAAFVANLELTGSGATTALRAGLGELGSLHLGELALEHVPAASLPVPVLASFGNRRPEVIVGFSLFLESAVRIDFAKNELVLSRRAESIVAAGAQRVPLRILEGKPVVDAVIDGVQGPFLLDTGNAGGLDLVKPWATAHGLPGQRPTLDLLALTGAGTERTHATLFRAAKSALGPIAHDARLVQIDDPPEPGSLAGLVGNEVFSHCTAVIFDVPQRTLWLEPPCNRRSPEAKAGWRLTKNESPEFKDRPWVIDEILKGSAAEAAGLRVGDRLLAVGGAPAELDSSNVQVAIEQFSGTKLTVFFNRKGESRQTVLVLRQLLAP